MSKDYTREELLYLSRLAEQCDRFDEMVGYVMEFAQQGDEELTEDERNILSVAFKNVVGSRRAAWRVISLIERKENKKGAAQNAEKAKNYKRIIEKELTDQCRKIIDLLNDCLLGNCKSTEGQVFFQKMKADYYRYIAEYSQGDTQDKAANTALEAYEAAQSLATNGSLSPTHPIRLGLALNFSVFYYEIKKNANKACKMARDAFDDAIADLDNVEDEFYKDATLIMQLLRDNLTLWTEEVEAEAAEHA
jgi:14-3-3 protein epsilon